MHKLNRQNCYGFSFLLLFISYISLFSCVSVKKSIYFNDLPDTMSTPYLINHTTKYVDPKIESNDILSINIQTVAQSIGNAGSNTSGTFNALNGNLVDKNGYIELALIGFVKVAGLTTTEARELIKQKAKEFYNDPVVNVRIANFDISVLGDVQKPGTINSPSEKVSILDAIALSGDLPLTAKRNNILLIRTEGDEKKFVRLDLNSDKIFQSPYFYLKQRDVIYVQPNKYKIQSSDQSFLRNLGIFSTLLSIAEIFIILNRYK